MTKTARGRARSRDRAKASLEKAHAALAAAEKARTCASRVESASRAIEYASHAACEASGYRDFRLSAALGVMSEARSLLKTCARKGPPR